MRPSSVNNSAFSWMTVMCAFSRASSASNNESTVLCKAATSWPRSRVECNSARSSCRVGRSLGGATGGARGFGCRGASLAPRFASDRFGTSLASAFFGGCLRDGGLCAGFRCGGGGRAGTSLGSSFLSLRAAAAFSSCVAGFSFTRSAYRNVFIVWSVHDTLGPTQAIIATRLRGRTKESRRTMVNFEARNGTCASFVARPRMHSLSANKLLLISADSVRSCRLWLRVSWPRSLPARSTNERLPLDLPSLSLIDILHTACERDDASLTSVFCFVRSSFPREMAAKRDSASSTGVSANPTT
mmetsp:Transcript_26562/g.68982  ORF Transcript_26562/g.68982 Transcript_26562/m.68982 type:complete len:300 (-) Transcript_26562:991-1890(-)